MKSKLLATFLFSLMTLSKMIAQAESQDFFRSTGKINTVLAVVVILFLVLIIYLFRLESKIGKLEKQVKHE